MESFSISKLKGFWRKPVSDDDSSHRIYNAESRNCSAERQRGQLDTNTEVTNKIGDSVHQAESRIFALQIHVIRLQKVVQHHAVHRKEHRHGKRKISAC